MTTKKKKTDQIPVVITGYKGFDKNLQCRGFQFKEGETYTHDGPVKACSSGFHFCENPLDIFHYYAPSESVFHEVEGGGQTDQHSDDSKIACAEIKIGASLKLHDFIGASLKFLFSRKYETSTSNHITGDRSASSATGYSSASSATGDRSASSATGDRSASSATGYRSASSATGISSASSATGDRSASSATGDSSVSSATGYSSVSSATGDSSVSSATGERSASSATGNSSASSATGDSSAAVSTGHCSKAMAGKYGCIALCFWNSAEERDEMRCAETGCGDGSDGKLKAEVWYILNDAGDFVEI